MLNTGKPIGNEKISLLMYADDIALIAENPIEMQKILDCVNDWCKQWKMKINMGKTKIMETHKKGTERSIAKFRLGNKLIEKCEEYKYLGIYLDEFLDFKKNTEVLIASGLRGLGALIGKFKISLKWVFKLLLNAIMQVLRQ